MATTLSQICGFESGNLLEATATAGSPAVNTTSPVRSGVYSLKLAGAATAAMFELPGRYTAAGAGIGIANARVLVGFAVQFSDLTPGTAYDFLLFWETSTYNARLRLATNGDLLVIDGNNSVAATISAPFTVNTWHYIEFYVHVADSGAWEVFIDGSSVSSGSGDFLATGAIVDTYFQFSGPGSGDGTVVIDDVYAISDDTAQPTAYGPSEVFPYQSGLASGVPDSGATLDIGQWGWTGYAPWGGAPGGSVQYSASNVNGQVLLNDSNANGHGPGPSGGAYTVSGTIRGSKMNFRGFRGNGGGTTHHSYYGNNNDGVTTSADMGLGTNTSLHGFVSTAATIVPTSSEIFVVGIGTTGAQDIFCSVMQQYLLHTPSGTPPTSEPRRMALTGVGY